VRVAISERNTLSVRAAQASARRWRVMPEIARRWYPRADAILAVSHGVAVDLAATLGLARERIAVTGNPVVTPDLQARARERLDHPWLRPGEPPVVLGVGKLKPQKGFDVLVDAFARARAKRPLRLVILGQGPERARLLDRARRLAVAEDVALPGFVANPFAWMARCGVFALSSRFEGLPGVLIQALACGCPVVSTDCPSGPAEILEPGAVAPRVPVGDAVALGDALLRALDAPASDRDARLARAAEYSVEQVAPRYLDALLAPATSARKAASRSATAA
jgi:glycosyltransferase involved in cell wall biosynthesis